MKKIKHSLSNYFVLLSLIILITSMIVILSLIFYSWYTSVKETSKSLIEDMNANIQEQIDAYMKIPENMVQSGTVMLETGTINLEDNTERNSFFVSMLKNNDPYIYSFSIGTELGAYYGARRDEKGELQIMKNDSSTNGKSLYYSVTNDYQEGKELQNAGPYDPRTREWYISSREANQLTFSKVYKHFFMDDLTISVTSPIHDQNQNLKGVLGTHIILSYINGFLENVTKDKSAIAFIYESDTGYLIANSLGMNNYYLDADGVFNRIRPSNLDNENAVRIYEDSLSAQSSQFASKGYQVQKNIYTQKGISWVVVVSVPEKVFFGDMSKNILFTMILTMIFLVAALSIYYMVTRNLLSPLSDLMEATKDMAQGNLSRRLSIVRQDEIGQVSTAFNEMADTMNNLVNNLEATVWARTEELQEINGLLGESKQKLSSILNSTAEAILGIDRNGFCVFCNQSFLRMSAIAHHDEVIGLRVEEIIHFRSFSSMEFDMDADVFFEQMKKGVYIHLDTESLQRQDDTIFAVELFSYPQYQEGQIIGEVITFLDITERKENEKRIAYLNSHDYLTGLYNRRYFEDAIIELDRTDNLPISVLFCDINGLKLTNDVFGHSEGDRLIKKCAAALKEVCGSKGVVSRTGGDEFVVILPRCNESDAENLAGRLRDKLNTQRLGAVRCSMAIGFETKLEKSEELSRVIDEAENKMYHEKTALKARTDHAMIKAIISTLHEKDPVQKAHSLMVSKVVSWIGEAMRFSGSDLKKLRELGFMHDIGMIIFYDEKNTDHSRITLSDGEEGFYEHSDIGYRIFNLFDKTLDLAEYIYAHHENWDGSGYPKNIKGEEIPLFSRILAVADRYSVLCKNVLQDRPDPQIIEKLQSEKGTLLDPEITDILIEILKSQ